MVLNECSRNVGSQVCNIDTDHKWIFLFLKRLVSTHWDNEFSSNSVMNWWNIAKWFVYWARIREMNLRWNYKCWPVGIGAKLRLDRCNVFIRPPVFRQPPPRGEWKQIFDFRHPPGVTENRKSVFIHPPHLISDSPPLIIGIVIHCTQCGRWTTESVTKSWL